MYEVDIRIHDEHPVSVEQDIRILEQVEREERDEQHNHETPVSDEGSIRLQANFYDMLQHDNKRNIAHINNIPKRYLNNNRNKRCYRNNN